jgi:hypothetical protein
MIYTLITGHSFLSNKELSQICGGVSSNDVVSLLGLSPFDTNCDIIGKQLLKGTVTKDGKVTKSQIMLNKLKISYTHMSMNVNLVLLVDQHDCVKVPFLPEYKKQVCHHFQL